MKPRGRGVHALFQAPAVRLEIQPTGAELKMLHELVASGVFGSTLEEVVTTMMRVAMRDAILQGFIKGPRGRVVKKTGRLR